MKKILGKNMYLHIMMMPAMAILIIYHYIPMLGIVISLQNYKTYLGMFRSDFVGLKNFITLFTMIGFKQALINTIFIAVMKIVARLVVPIVFACLLNEVGKKQFKKTAQTIIYLPHFISWVLMAGIIINILSPYGGIVNKVINLLGFDSIFFLGNNTLFPYLIVITDVWKEFGWITIIYMAALTGIDPTFYEAAVIDGAGHWKQTIHITLPSILSTILLMALLSVGNILNAGFDQIFNLVSPITYDSGDIIDTLIYRLGMENAQFGLSTAASLFKSTISCTLIIISYKLAYRFTGYKIF